MPAVAPVPSELVQFQLSGYKKHHGYRAAQLYGDITVTSGDNIPDITIFTVTTSIFSQSSVMFQKCK